MAQLTPDLVARAGIALYGEHWQMPLARLLNVADRTVRRVAQAARTGDEYQVNQAWAPEIVAALQPIPLEREIQGRYAAEVLDALQSVGDARRAAMTPPLSYPDDGLIEP